MLYSNKGDGPNFSQITKNAGRCGKVLFLMISFMLTHVSLSLYVEFDGGEGRVASS